MTRLNTQINLGDHDELYQSLMDLHQDKTEEQSRELNAILVLLLSNHIGDTNVLQQAMHIAAEQIGDYSN